MLFVFIYCRKKSRDDKLIALHITHRPAQTFILLCIKLYNHDTEINSQIKVMDLYATPTLPWATSFTRLSLYSEN